MPLLLSYEAANLHTPTVHSYVYIPASFKFGM